MLCSCYIFYDRNPGCEEVNKIKTNPYSTSTLSRDCGHGNYEIIQLNEASNNHTLHQTGYNECTYIEVIEHEYDYTYGDIKPVSDNTVWPLLPLFCDIHIVTLTQKTALLYK